MSLDLEETIGRAPDGTFGELETVLALRSAYCVTVDKNFLEFLVFSFCILNDIVCFLLMSLNFVLVNDILVSILLIFSVNTLH